MSSSVRAFWASTVCASVLNAWSTAALAFDESKDRSGMGGT
jgi:hypothetical protein